MSVVCLPGTVKQTEIKDTSASMFMKLRITRSAASPSHIAVRCLASKPIFVEPGMLGIHLIHHFRMWIGCVSLFPYCNTVPTVLRVSGSATYDPSYGIYTAQRVNGFQDANLIYKYTMNNTKTYYPSIPLSQHTVLRYIMC